jgi:hypothetical protein
MEGFSANIVENLRRPNANANALRPLRGVNGLIDTLKKIERLPRVGGAGIAGIAGILSNEVGRGVNILSGAAANQQRSLDQLSIVGELDDDYMANAGLEELEPGTQPQPHNNANVNTRSLAAVGAAQNAAARNAAARNAAGVLTTLSAPAPAPAPRPPKRNRNGNPIQQAGSGKSRKSRKSKARKNTRKVRKN